MHYAEMTQRWHSDSVMYKRRELLVGGSEVSSFRPLSYTEAHAVLETVLAIVMTKLFSGWYDAGYNAENPAGGGAPLRQ